MSESRDEDKAARFGIFGKYAYGWITLGFFLVSLVLHWWFGWRSFLNEAQSHHQAAQFTEYLDEMMRDTFENWQSEFLQLMWQVIGLAYFLYVGSPSSKENDDRMEAKVDALMRMVSAEKADQIIDRIDRLYLRDHGHARPHAHDQLDGVIDDLV